MAPEPLVPLKPTGTWTALYCVHSASGSVYSYASLVPLLNADQPLYGLEAPGLDDEREPLLTSVTDLSGTYLRAIAEHRPDEPICLLGWSLGGVIAYDMALQLEAAGTPASMLITVDAEIPAPGPVPSRRVVLLRFVEDLAPESSRANQHRLQQALASVSDYDPVEHAFTALTRAQLISAELDIDTLVRRYAVFHANLVALYGYQPARCYSGPMISVRAADSRSEGMDWSGLVTAHTELTVPGDHYSMWQGDGLAALGEIIHQARREVCLPGRVPTPQPRPALRPEQNGDRPAPESEASA